MLLPAEFPVHVFIELGDDSVPYLLTSVLIRLKSGRRWAKGDVAVQYAGNEGALLVKELTIFKSRGVEEWIEDTH